MGSSDLVLVADGVAASLTAAATFERMLWLNPTDNREIRFVLPEVRAGDRWNDRHAES